MAADDSLFKALQMFQEGVQHIGLQSAISQASEYADQVKESGMKEEEKRQALRGVANKLTMYMASNGTPGTTIEQVAAAFQPKTPATPEAALMQGYQTGDQSLIDLGKNTLKAQAGIKSDTEAAKQELMYQRMFKLQETAQIGQEKRAQMQADLRNTQNEQKLVQNSQKQYFSQITKLDQVSSRAKQAIQLLDSGSPLTATAILPMLARASGEVGNLTEIEQQRFAGRQDYFSKLQRLVMKGSISQLPEEDKTELRKLAELYANYGDQLKSSYAKTLAGQLSLNSSLDEETAFKKVTGGRLKYTPDSPTINSTQMAASSATLPQIPGFKPYNKK